MKNLLLFLSILLWFDPIRSKNKTKPEANKIIPVQPSPKVKLNDGYEIPIVGYGTWKIVWDKTFPKLAKKFNKDQPVIDAIERAVKTGYRYIDTAWYYNNEKAIGMALKKLFKEGVVSREDMFIATKVWINFHSKDRVTHGLKQSVHDLGIDFVDLALIHFPTSCKNGDNPLPTFFINRTLIPRTWNKDAYLETWEGMELAQEKGWVRSIGVANFDTHQLKKIIDNGQIKPSVNQVECNPYYQQNKVLRFCVQKNITMIAYSPLRQANALLGDPVLKKIAKDKNVTTAQVALRWNVQRDVVVIPKTIRSDKMSENLNIFKFELSGDEMDRIDKIKQNPKNLIIKQFLKHPDYPIDENKEL